MRNENKISLYDFQRPTPQIGGSSLGQAGLISYGKRKLIKVVVSVIEMAEAVAVAETVAVAAATIQ